MAGGVILTPDSLSTDIADLKRRLARLESSPRMTQASIQQGSTTILDANLTRRALFGFDAGDGSYGVKVYDASGRPLLTNDGGTVVDGSGVTRMKWGKLDSTPTYGLAWYDASGNLIGDTTGLQQEMKNIGSCDASPPNQSIVLDGVTNFDIAGASTSISLSRAVDVLLTYFFTVRTRLTSGTTGNFAYASVYAGASFGAKTFQTGSLIFDKANPGYLTATGWARIAGVPAGTTRFAMTIFGDNGLMADVYQTHLDVYRLGA